MRISRWLAISYSLIIFLGILIAIPNLFTPEQMERYAPFFPDTRITLGLDLRGGSSLQLEIDKEALKQENLRKLLEKIRNILRNEQISSLSVRIIGNNIIAIFPNEEEQKKAFRAVDNMLSSISIDNFQTSLTSEYTLVQEKKALRFTIAEKFFDHYLKNILDQSLEIIRQRIDKIGIIEPSIQKVGLNRIQVQLPGLQNSTHIRALLGTTAKISFHIVHQGVNPLNPPVGISILPGYKEGSVERYAVEDKISIDGALLETARASYDTSTNRPMVEFSFNSIGAKEFAKITRENLGKPLAIILDNQVLTAPVIQSVIPNGRGQITGNFTVAETITLSALLRAGALPAPLKIIEERIVGPDLGADAIRMGLYTGFFGFVLVAVFIFLLYGMWGLIANLALALHTILTLSSLSILGATLTLPGIAGIILSIGVAVDANILINERIREESRKKGVGALAALDRGFRYAFSTIVDASVTIVVAVCLLYMFGTGPIRGFAVTMLIGIVISMFTDIALVRTVMQSIIRRKKLKILHIRPFFNFVPQKMNFCFMNARWIGITISLLFSIVSIFLFFKPGLNYGIDFKGGIQIELSNKEELDLWTLRRRLSNLHIGEVTLQTLDNSRSVLLRLQLQGEEKELTAVSAIRKNITEIYPEVIFQKTEIVGPKISSELAKAGLIAVIFAGFSMSCYIWWRFEWSFAVGALTTLVLDITKMLGIFAIFRFDFNLTAIAALMTIVGYSINDKIVVYDRVRENLLLYSKKTLREIIDISINQVCVRCIFTSLTTVLAILPMTIWGGNSVYNFSLPVIIGVVLATSSSIFIAAPILLFLENLCKYNRKNPLQ